MEAGVTRVKYCPPGPLQRPAVRYLQISSMSILACCTLYLSYLTCVASKFVNIRFAGIILFVGFLLVGSIHRKCERFLKADQEALISPAGIIFPFGSTLLLRGRRWRRWEELKSAYIVWLTAGEFGSRDALVLEFRDGSKANFWFATMSPRDLEKLLIAVEMWAPPDKLLGGFNDARNYLSNSLKMIGAPSFTALWNDELSRRFSLATFRPLSPGTKLQNGCFEITSQLGFGGFAAVYNGVNQQGKLVVIKELALDRFGDDAMQQSVLEHAKRETALLSKLHHPRICQLIDSFVENERLYTVLEKISGATLREIVAESGPMKEPAVIQLALQMLELLTYLHQRTPPVVHRDFTPENLILKNGKHLMLIDFNAATQFMAGLTGTVIGKHAYMPPEQIRGKAEPSSDYYTMAGTLSFLLSGKDPHPLTPIDLRKSGLSVEPELNRILVGMTQQDVNDRIKIEDIAQQIQQCALAKRKS